MWPVVDGMRALELGSPGAMQARLNALVLAGTKRATAGLHADYLDEAEPLEQVGEELALVDETLRRLATVRVTGCVVRRFDDVDLAFAHAEGEGFATLEEWRRVHREAFTRNGDAPDGDAEVACIAIELVPGSTTG